MQERSWLDLSLPPPSDCLLHANPSKCLVLLPSSIVASSRMSRIHLSSTTKHLGSLRPIPILPFPIQNLVLHYSSTLFLATRSSPKPDSSLSELLHSQPPCQKNYI